MDDDFSDDVNENQPIVPQIEAYAQKNAIRLEIGWKVEVARQVKTKMLKSDPLRDNKDILEVWKVLFEKITLDAPVLTSAR